MLTKDEIKQYSRQVLLPEIGIKGQQKLKEAKVLVIGAGGLGCPALQYLAAAGVGTIGIVDFDKVDASNLQRQILYSVHDIGKSKSKAAAQKLHFLNPLIQLSTFNFQLSTENAFDLISGFDLILDCTDNFQTRYLINDACVLAGKPFIYAGIYKYEGQLSVFNYNDGPTYRCAFPETHSRKAEMNCTATGVIPTLPGIIGTMQANEAIKLITGIGTVTSGKMILFNALHNTFSEIKLKRNERLWIGIPKSKEELMNMHHQIPETVN